MKLQNQEEIANNNQNVNNIANIETLTRKHFKTKSTAMQSSMPLGIL